MFLDQKLELASNLSTSPEILAELANDENVVVRTKVALNPNTSAFTLDKLLTDEDCVVRYRATDNPNIQLSTLEMLVETQADSGFRAQRVCTRIFRQEIQNIQDPIISVEELIVFSKSSHFLIRGAVAESAKSPTSVLKELASDRVWYVRRAVAKNFNTPVEVLAELANDKDVGVRVEVAKNLNTPVEVLAKLAKNSSQYQSVREALEDSLITPSGVRRILATNVVTLNDKNLETPAIVATLMVALELGYLDLESAVLWADRAIEDLENPNTWIVEISSAKSLTQIYGILRNSGYYDSQFEAESYIGLSCLSWMDTPWLKDSLLNYAFVDKMRLVFMDAMESDESYSKLYYAMDRLASSPDVDHSYIQRDEDFIEAQKLCLQLCEKAKKYLSLFINEV